MESKTSPSHRPDSLDILHLPTAKSTIDMDSTPVLTATGAALKEVNGTASTTSDTTQAVPLLQSQKNMARIQFMTLLLTLFLIGCNDASLGPLLPRIRVVYHAGYVNVSLIFICTCVGYVGGAIANIYLTDILGFGKMIALGSILQAIAYAIQACAPPFPVFVMAYSIVGVGMVLQDAQANGFVASLKDNPETKLGILHAAYGLGAFASPLIATQFAQLPHWSFYFLVSLGITIANVVLLITVFKLKRQDECLLQAGEIIPEKDPNTTGSENLGTFNQIFTSRTVHSLAFFVFVYEGAQVTIGGWIVTFIINVRGGGPSSGYISSGFYGGITVGRIALLRINKMLGGRRALFIYTVLAVVLDIIIWFTPSLVGNAIAVSFLGFLLGPIFPVSINHATRILPRRILTSSIGWIAGLGQVGSATFPFMAGAMASKWGIKSLPPLLVTMMVFMIVLWALVPAGPRPGRLNP